jgi:hypothetical protein
MTESVVEARFYGVFQRVALSDCLRRSHHVPSRLSVTCGGAVFVAIAPGYLSKRLSL